MPERSSLARLLQASCFVQLACAVAWCAWWWPQSPWQALAGAAVVFFIAPMVLGLEFILLSQVVRGDDVAPRASVAQLVRAWWSETLHLYRTFCWRQPFRWRAEPDHFPASASGRTGIVFVHGFMCNRGFWAPWMKQLRPHGRALLAVNLEPVHGPIGTYAATIDAAVARVTQATGRPPVLVCHSMGGLAARAWWREAGERRVAGLVTIGSPHRGTWMGRFSRRANSKQMRLDCDWVCALGESERLRPLPPTTCWYSNCDNIVFPPRTATLPPARNRLLNGEAHVALAFHPEVLRSCIAFLEEADCGGQGESVTRSAAENV